MTNPLTFTDEDRAALAQECTAFRRGVAASIRALEVHTPLATGSIATLGRLLEACSPRRDPPLPPLDHPAVVTIHDLPEGAEADVVIIQAGVAVRKLGKVRERGDER
jgi:hypothetical protein